MPTRAEVSESSEHDGHTDFLLSKGADVSGRFTQTGKTALMLAIEKDYTDIAQLLQAAETEQASKSSRRLTA